MKSKSQRPRLEPGSQRSWLFSCLLLAAVTAWLCGCLNLKPAADITRFYLLSPLSTAEPQPGPKRAASLALGLGPVAIPAYLDRNSLAVRHGTNEIAYLVLCQWAEPLSRGVPRVLAQDLSVLLPSNRLRVGAWRRGDVSFELHVRLVQFDVDEQGLGTLVAAWRIASPGDEKTLKTGQAHLTRSGAPPATNAQGAVATLSELLVQLARDLVQELKDARP